MRIDLAPPVDLDAQKVDASAAIDSAAGAARSRYITTVPGQEATYTAKATEADAYKAAGFPAPLDAATYPWIASEAGATAQDPQVLAETIIATRDAWVLKGAQIEGARMGGKAAVTAATTPATIAAARRTAIAQLDSL